MLKSGEVFVRYMVNGNIQWAKDVLLFMFDQAIVICKKDLLKKNFYIFKDRMSLESVSLVDCKDGKGWAHLKKVVFCCRALVRCVYKELVQANRHQPPVPLHVSRQKG